MPRVMVNNEEVAWDPAAKTWGDLLARLDDACHAQGCVVTAARLDGVDEPSFRSPAAGDRLLGGLSVVEIDAQPPASLLADAIREAGTGLDRLCAHALDVARRFRGRDLAQAQQSLLALVQGLQVLTSLVATIGIVLQTDLGSLLWNGRPASSLIDGVGSHLEALIDAQQREDWITVADIVEYDVEPALRACGPLFEALGAAAATSH
jgi:hypothetical protein